MIVRAVLKAGQSQSASSVRGETSVHHAAIARRGVRNLLDAPSVIEASGLRRDSVTVHAVPKAERSQRASSALDEMIAQDGMIVRRGVRNLADASKETTGISGPLAAIELSVGINAKNVRRVSRTSAARVRPIGRADLTTGKIALRVLTSVVADPVRNGVLASARLHEEKVPRDLLDLRLGDEARDEEARLTVDELAEVSVRIGESLAAAPDTLSSSSALPTSVN